MKIPRFPNLTFKGLVKGLAHEISKDDVTTLAAQMAYYFLFAMFPMMVFVVALLGFLPIADLTEQFLAQIRPAVPKEFYEIIATHVHDVIYNERPALLSFSAVIAVYSASAGVSATVLALNRAYDVEESRGFFKTKGLALGLTVGMSLLILTATALIFGGDYVADYISGHFGQLGTWYATGWKVLQWLLAPCAVLLALAFLYYLGPDVKQEWKWVTPGSAFATILWLVVTAAFSWYVSSFGNFNATYGSLGGVMVTMLWLYLSSLVILIGGELNALLEHASAEGKEKGERAPGVQAEPAQRPEVSGKPADAPTERVAGGSADRPKSQQDQAGEAQVDALSGKSGSDTASRQAESEEPLLGPPAPLRDERRASRRHNGGDRRHAFLGDTDRPLEDRLDDAGRRLERRQIDTDRSPEHRQNDTDRSLERRHNPADRRRYPDRRSLDQVSRASRADGRQPREPQEEAHRLEAAVERLTRTSERGTLH